MKYYIAAVVATLFYRFEPELEGLKDQPQNTTPYLDPDQVCYDFIGCFSNRAPWYTGPRRPFPPQSPEKVSTYMYFHNRETGEQNGTKFQIYPEVDLSNVPFSENKPTFVIIHDIQESGDMPQYIDLAKALLNRVDANVFVVDYSASALVSFYYQLLGDIRVAGRLAAIVLLKTKIPPSRIHFIGHGLGAHATAYAANYITEKSSKPARITGLDIAYPQFEIYTGETVRLEKSDATLVDNIHTTAGQDGTLLPNSHVSFYVSGGLRQPGCEEKGKSVKEINLCSHRRSVLIFIKSLEYDGCIVGEKRLAVKVLVPASTVAAAAAAKIFIPGVSRNSSLHCDKRECLSMGLGVGESGQEGIFEVPTSNLPYVCNNKF